MKKMRYLCLRIALIICCSVPHKTNNFPLIPISVALISLFIGTWCVAKKYNISWKDALVQLKKQLDQQKTSVIINNQITLIEYKPKDDYLIYTKDIDFNNSKNNRNPDFFVESNNESINSENIYNEFYTNIDFNNAYESDEDSNYYDDLLNYSNEENDYSNEEENKMKELEQIDYENFMRKTIEEKIKMELMSLFASVKFIQKNYESFVVAGDKVEKLKELHNEQPRIFRSFIKKDNFLLISEALKQCIVYTKDKKTLQKIAHMCLPYTINNNSFELIYQQLVPKKK